MAQQVQAQAIIHIALLPGGGSQVNVEGSFNEIEIRGLLDAVKDHLVSEMRKKQQKNIVLPPLGMNGNALRGG